MVMKVFQFIPHFGYALVIYMWFVNSEASLKDVQNSPSPRSQPRFPNAIQRSPSPPPHNEMEFSSNFPARNYITLRFLVEVLFVVSRVWAKYCPT